ncbi:MAG: AAA family ATPase [Candidatus Methylumidiphilus sp.]
MPVKITRLDIEGFRSLRKVSWHPGDLNVVIGPNGSGKSNLLHFLELISVSAQGRLGKYIQSLGGMDAIVWDGVAASIKYSLDLLTQNIEFPEHYELELGRLGSGSSYKVDNELLINSFEFRKKRQEQPFKFLEKQGNNAFVADQVRWSSEPFTQEEESLLSFATGPFIKNRFIPLFN